jgi:hypothetical protein
MSGWVEADRMPDLFYPEDPRLVAALTRDDG